MWTAWLANGIYETPRMRKSEPNIPAADGTLIVFYIFNKNADRRGFDLCNHNFYDVH